MTKLEICAIEDANPGQVNLYIEGSFYKAYQKSAWLGDGHYGRYVDDAYVVGGSSAELRRLIPLAKGFLQDNLGLSLSWNKIAVFSAYRGVEFLGAYLKPFRRYVGNRCLARMEGKYKFLSRHDFSLSGL